MVAADKSMFRKKALERLSSPESLDQLLRLVDPKSWIPLATLAVLVGFILLWAVFGRVPVNVHGKGILVKPRKVVEFQAPGTGHLLDCKVRVGDVVRKGDVLGLIAQPDVEMQIRLQQAKLQELTAQSEAAQALREERTGMETSSSDTQSEILARHVDTSRRLAEDLRDKGRQFVQEEKARLEERLAMSKEMATSLEERLDNYKELEAAGYLSKEHVVGAEEAYMAGLMRVSSIEAQLGELKSQALKVEEDYANRMQKVADLEFEMRNLDIGEKRLAQENLESAGSYERQIADVRREIARLQQCREKEGKIVAEHDGRILELSTVLGQVVTPGMRLGSMEVDDPESPLLSLTYFTVRDGKRLQPGTAIQVTPDTVERQRFGSILGTTTTISAFPVSLAEVENVVGNPELARTLVEGGYMMQVFAELEPDPETYSGFRWSSSRGPDMKVSAGTTTTARAVVEKRAPIAFVLPIFRSAVGMD